MGTIRKQSIISSVIIYTGFAIGLINTFFFTKEGLFKGDEYGLTTIFVNLAGLMMSLSVIAMPNYIFKFFHYYNDRLPPQKNDMLTWALLVTTIGFVLVGVAGYFFQELVVRKFNANSPLLVDYYYWLFPMGFGLSIYTVLEAYAWGMGKPIITVFLREVQWRAFVSILIILFSFGIIKDFSIFIKLYSLTYAGIAILLLVYLVWSGEVHFTFRISKITRRFLKTIVRLCSFIYAGSIILSLSQVFDTIVIASILKDGAALAGIFGLAQYMSNVIQAGQRSVIAASITHLSKAWKEKDMPQLQRIYQRSSLNLLIFALALFFLILLNYKHAISTFQLKEIYLSGFGAFILLGLTRVVDMGTGVNAQIIGTSTYWKFELLSGVVLLAFMLPLSYVLAQRYGIIGPAIANLVSVTLYNTIRIIFLWKKFRLFPFSLQSIYSILLMTACYLICYFAFITMDGFWGMIFRSVLFMAIAGFSIVYFKLSPDVLPVWQTIKKRLRINKTD